MIGLVVHPRRPLDAALEDVRAWVAEHGDALGQIPVAGQDRRVADPVDVGACDLVLAMGGDGTVLAALHAAGPVDRPVLGVACGSLGALSAVRAADVGDALDRFFGGDWTARHLPQLAITREDELVGHAFNDLVVVRAGAGQVILDVEVDGGPYARIAGDGVIVATPLGSSAYTLAAGGPLLAASADAIVVTPLAPHGGSVPPVVLGPGSRVTLGVDGGWSGARTELDGRIMGVEQRPGLTKPFTLDVVLEADSATLVDLGGETFIAGLRRRGVVADSPRLRARDARNAGNV